MRRVRGSVPGNCRKNVIAPGYTIGQRHKSGAVSCLKSMPMP